MRMFRFLGLGLLGLAASAGQAQAGFVPLPPGGTVTSFAVGSLYNYTVLAAQTHTITTGPLAGTTVDSAGHRTTVPRFHFSLESVTQLHADIGWFIAALAVALVIGLRFAGAPPRTVRLGW